MGEPRQLRASLDLLRGFCAAARHLSFTRAAQELFVTQSAISREIKTLEERLGKPLFRRVNRTLQLTQAGQELYRSVEEPLAQIEAATQRAADKWRTISVTTTVALASTWFVRRLPRFVQLHPEIDMRFLASNDALDLGREHIDVAIRYVPIGMATPSTDKLFDYEQFPVCVPTLAMDPVRPLCTPAELSKHVELEFETVVYGRPWYDWQQWSNAVGLSGAKGASWLRFSHYDQVIEAAIKGSGVAIGKLPHLSHHLREGVLVAPLGAKWVARPGSFYVEVADTAQRDVVDVLIDWLHDEARRDAKLSRQEIAPPRSPRQTHGRSTTVRATRR